MSSTGEGLAGTAQSLQRDAPIEDPRLAAGQHAGETGTVALTEVGRDHELGQRPADRLRAAEAEHLLRGPVELDHAPRRIDRDDRIKRPLDTSRAAAARAISTGSEQMQREIGGVATVAEQSAAATEEVSASTEQTSASTQEIAASAEALARTAVELERMIGRFRLEVERAVAGCTPGG